MTPSSAERHDLAMEPYGFDQTLWGTWNVTEVVDASIQPYGLPIARAGVTAQSQEGLIAFGSAASLSGAPMRRAWFELLERVSLLEASRSEAPLSITDPSGRLVGTISPEDAFPSSMSDGWQYSRSNGVALGSSLSQARSRALLELAERDALLGAWYTQAPPTPVSLGDLPGTVRASYEWRAFSVPAPIWCPGMSVIGVFALPYESNSGPLLRGFAADETPHRALSRALQECWQSLAFLYEEPLPTSPPEPTPTPLFHLDHYLFRSHHDSIRRWLNGHRPRGRSSAASTAELTFVDLTPVPLRGKYFVIRAMCKDAVPLVFGAGPPWVEPDVQIHPFA